MKQIIKYILCLCIASIAFASTVSNQIKLYVVYTYKFDEKVIERIYLKKENAQKYCDNYKDSHNYTFEEVIISE